MKIQIQVGMKVKDKITGFAGTVTGVVRYISGCNQALVVPPAREDGSFISGEWFDLQRLEITSQDVLVLDNSITPGADRAPTRRA